MAPISIAGIPFGDGRTKICVPLTAASLSELEEEAQAAAGLPADLYEWRVDLFTGSPAAGLDLLRERLPRPLLVTLRTKTQGGGWEGSPEDYERAVLELVKPGVALVDVELSWGEERVLRLGEAVRAQGAGLVVSHHDFTGTPGRKEMAALLARMKSLGADLPKLAVTPRCPEDVLALMEASRQEAEALGPVITMSMGALGQLSRISGRLTGSCLSFAAGLRPSAPGQLGAEELRHILDVLEGEA